MELANSFGPTMDSMRENGRMICKMGEEDISTLTGMFMMGTGKMESLMGREGTSARMGNMRDNGMRIKKQGKELKKE